ncbi:hypothetical protein A9995_05960 [Erythrobacter sp. QSSC1-22B]|uniref:dioxygenase family protein n=1 Tax=Erythrobacter sp. QSSC1-22B TaxID=1860125 RepID=UPI00080486D0|nr:class III extradiol ring-cleavage dioxygenase [Erythrobacter sp. QSSC1-22B]OBX20072.1 hypothetical protein A9995_05960 [Erythrobacter sp. QSSC1-22B]
MGWTPPGGIDVPYPAPGSSALAAEIVELAHENGFEAGLQENRGFDHGAWIPLHLIYPAADIPVVQVSISMRESPRWHFQLGEMLASLREKNVLIIGSGNLTHKLSEFFRSGFRLNAPREGWVSDFAEWIARKIREGDVDAVLRAVNTGPSGRRNHPTMDHIHPLFVALGAGDSPLGSLRLHQSTTYGVLAMDVFGFGGREQLGALQDRNVEHAL